MGYHYRPNRPSGIKKILTPTAGEDVGNLNHSYMLVGMKICIVTLENSLADFTKQKIQLPHDQQVNFWIFIPETWRLHVYTKTYVPISRAALFIIAQSWKQPRCLLGVEWSHRMIPPTVKYYSVTKRTGCWLCNKFQGRSTEWKENSILKGYITVKKQWVNFKDISCFIQQSMNQAASHPAVQNRTFMGRGVGQGS